MYPYKLQIFNCFTVPKAAQSQSNANPESVLNESAAELRKQQLGTISTEIKTARNQAGLTVTDLHKKTGISRNVLQGYESGKFAPGTLELRKICEILRVTPNRILYGNEQPMKAKTSLAEYIGDAKSVRGSALLSLFFTMLSGNEATAVLTLLESIIRAKVGGDKQIQQAYDALDAAFSPSLLDAITSSVETAATQHFTPDRVDKLNTEFSKISNR